MEELQKDLPGMAQDGIHAGFPSPATDYMTQAIDLNKELVRHPAATFYGRVVGDSMIDAGVEEGDILVIDKSLEPKDGDMAVCFVDGEFTLKYLSIKEDEIVLKPANPKYYLSADSPQGMQHLVPIPDILFFSNSLRCVCTHTLSVHNWKFHSDNSLVLPTAFSSIHTYYGR